MFDPVKPLRISESIVSQIKDKVLADELRPNDKLPSENELAAIFGASRATVREALRSLEGSGLIEIRRGARGGPFVAEHGLEHAGRSLSDALRVHGTPVEQVTEARLLVEPALARFAAERASDEDLAAIGSSLERVRSSLASGDTPVLGNLEFHRLVASASHNAVLVVLLDASLGILEHVLEPGAIDRDLVSGMLAAHQEIYDALTARQADGAERLMTEHVHQAHLGIEKACLF
jgi:DNA-binding FadR family transcriptional regulator